MPCESLTNKSMAYSVLSYTPGTFLATVASPSSVSISSLSSSRAVTEQSSHISATTTITTSAIETQSSPPNNTNSEARRPSSAPDNPDSETRRLVAISTGLGVPLIIAAICGLSLYFWKKARREPDAKSKAVMHWIDSSQGNTLQGEVVTRYLQGRELPDTQRPWELDHRTVRVEMPDRP